MAVDSPPQINASKIPIGRGIGAAVLIGILLVAMAAELPVVRVVAVWGTALGVLVGLLLIVWNRR